MRSVACCGKNGASIGNRPGSEPVTGGRKMATQHPGRRDAARHPQRRPAAPGPSRAASPQPTGGGMGPTALRGAIDLGALAAAREAARAAEERNRQRAAAGPGAVVAVIDVTIASFQADVLQRSFQVPVVVDLWASWCQPCKQLSPVLEKLADEAGGSWLLAKVDIDAEPDIAAAFRVQSVPSVMAVIKGQPVPLFTGALPEAQVREYLAELLKVAAENGVVGSLGSQAGAQPAAGDEGADAGLGAAGAPGSDRGADQYEIAYRAFDSGDWEAAAAAYRAVLADDPGDVEAAAGLARVELMRRVEGVDPAAAMEAAVADPTDVAATMLAADIQLLANDPEGAFRRIVDFIARVSGADRDAARAHLLELFEIVGSQAPAVAKARVALANALF